MKNLLIAASLTVAATMALAAEKEIDVSKLPPPVKKDGVTYEKHILPLFKKSCVECHGEEKQKGRLRLDTLENVLKGARGEPILVKGKSEKSILVHAVARLDPDEAMPPEGKGDPLTKEQIGLIRTWIDQGAK
ncbi:MAG: hypothetical protein H7A47_14515 [Verrucomicrobiales bacterium]|nr:hypothetical protein [Verrucomicrobiales bacterium]